MWIQLLVSLFVLFVWARLFYNYRSRRSALGTTLTWFGVWFAVAVIFWSPEIASRLALAVGIGRGADLIVYVAILALVYLVYRVFIRLEKIERDVTAVTRALALHHDRGRDHSSDTDRQL